MKGIENIFKLYFSGNDSNTIVVENPYGDGHIRLLDKRLNDLFDYRRFAFKKLIDENIAILKKMDENKFILIETSTGNRISDILFDEIYTERDILGIHCICVSEGQKYEIRKTSGINWLL